MQQIKIDFDNPGLPQHLEAMEGDAQSRFFQATLYRSGVAYTPPAGVAYSIMYRGFGEQNQGWYDTIEDDTGKRDACVASGNVVTCEIDRHALIVPGHVSIVLCITNDRGYMLKSRPILTDARNDNYNDTVEVESYFRITGKTSAWWLKNKKDVQDLVDKATAEATKAKNSADASATSAAASKGSADDSAAFASASANSAAAAARSESAAAGSATKAAGSASAAEESKTAAATSEANAAKHEEAAKKAADEAGAKAGTDKTLSVENAPADAKATGEALNKKANKDLIVDEDGNVLYYSKAVVDKLLAGKLDIKPETSEVLGPGLATGKDGLIETTFHNRGHVTDANEASNTGWYSIPENAANAPTADPGQILSFSSSGYILPCQIFISSSTNGIYFRTFNSANWNVWMAAGIVASGAGYVRFGDGTQICWGETDQIVVSANSTVTATIAYPAAFASGYPVEVSLTIAGNSENDSYSRLVLHTTNRATTNCVIYFKNTSSKSMSPIAQWIVIGRWK